MREWEIGVISVDRSRNCAYIYQQQNKPYYYATNTEVKLDWIEKLFGCTFNVDLPHIVIIHLYERDGDKLELEYL